MTAPWTNVRDVVKDGKARFSNLVENFERNARQKAERESDRATLEKRPPEGPSNDSKDLIDAQLTDKATSPQWKKTAQAANPSPSPERIPPVSFLDPAFAAKFNNIRALYVQHIARQEGKLSECKLCELPSGEYFDACDLPESLCNTTVAEFLAMSMTEMESISKLGSPRLTKVFEALENALRNPSESSPSPTASAITVQSHDQSSSASATSNRSRSLKHAFVGHKFTQPFFELRDRLDTGPLSAVRQWKLQRLCVSSERQLPAECLTLTVDEFLSSDPSVILVKPAVGKGGFRKLLALLTDTEDALCRINKLPKSRDGYRVTAPSKQTTIKSSQVLDTLGDLTDEIAPAPDTLINEALRDTDTPSPELSTPQPWNNLKVALHNGVLDSVCNQPLKAITRIGRLKLPRFFDKLTIRQLLSRDYHDVTQTPGVGAKKLAKLLQTLEDETSEQYLLAASNLTPITQDAPASQLNDNSLQTRIARPLPTDPAEKPSDARESSVAETRAWDENLARIIDFGFGLVKIGRMAPCLKTLSRELWGRRFSEYVGLSECQIRNLQGHGLHSAQELNHVLANVSKVLPAARHPHLSVAITSRETSLIHELLLEFIQLPEVGEEDIGEILDFIKQQLAHDLEGDAGKLAVEFILARQSQDATSALLGIAHNVGVTSKYIWDSLELAKSVFQVRWPEGSQLLSLFELQQEKASNPIGQRLIGAILETLYTGVREPLPQGGSTASSPRNSTPTLGDGDNSGVSLTTYLIDVLADKPMGLEFEQIAKDVLSRGYDSKSLYTQNVIYQCLHSQNELFRRSEGGRYFYLGNADPANLTDKDAHRVTGTTREIPHTGIQKTLFPQSGHTVTPSRRSPPKSGKEGNSGVPLVAYLIDVLRDKPMGLRVDAIAKEVLSRGYETKSHYFANVVYQCLYRTKNFFKGIEGGRYVYIGSTDQSDIDISKSQNNQESNIAQSAVDLPDDPLLGFLDLPEL